MTEDSALFTVFLEGLAASRDSQLIRDELHREYESFHSSMKSCLSHFIHTDPHSEDKDIDSLVTVILGIIDGIGVQFSVMPDLAKDEKKLGCH